VKLIRNGLVVVAVAASMVLPATAAHAASSTLKVTSLGGAGSQGWQIDDNRTTDFAFPNKFVAGNMPPIGTGSLQYAASNPTIEKEKMYVWRTESIPATEFRKVKFDYYFAPDSAVQTPSQIYLNLYVDTAAVVPPAFYDCKFDYIATKAADGKWSTLAVDQTDVASVTAKSGAVCGNSIAQLQPNDKITRIAINAGDTSANDAGMKGGFDNVFVKTKNSEITYDFDPAAVTPPAPVKACDNQNSLPLVDGTTRNDIKNGTGVAENIDLKAGNDISDAKGGADCVLGGEGNDQLTGGAGDDEIRAGSGNDIVFVKNDGNDTVDCGPGSDIVFADKNDTVKNCEVGQP
jgi:Ca2+-binding RTX toxin-like protein